MKPTGLSYEFSLSFPIEWSFGENPSDGMDGPPVEDAGTIYITMDGYIDSEPSGDMNLVGETTIKKMVAYTIDGAVSSDGLIHDEQIQPMESLMKELRSAADMIAERLATAPPAPTPTGRDT